MGVNHQESLLTLNFGIDEVQMPWFNCDMRDATEERGALMVMQINYCEPVYQLQSLIPMRSNTTVHSIKGVKAIEEKGP